MSRIVEHVVTIWRGGEEPVANVRVELKQSRNDEMETKFTAKTDETGWFHLDNVPAGTYQIEFTPEHFYRYGGWVCLKPTRSNPNKELVVTDVKPTATVWPQPKTPDERQLIKMQRALNDALATMNVDAFDRLTAENFVDVSPRGNVTTRADFLRQVGTIARQPRQTTNSDFNIRVYGRIAIVSFNSTPPSRVTHIFVKRNNHWKQHLRQTTPVRETLSPA